MATSELQNLLIIFNPLAGWRYGMNYQKNFLNLLKKFLPDCAYQWLETTVNLKGQLEKIQISLFDKIIIIGGDGTVKETAEYLLKHGLDIPLAIIPQGSANVLASGLNIPLTTKAALKRACFGQIKKIDVGLLNKAEYFLICVSIGFWSEVVNQTQRGLKIRLGFLAYLLTFLKQKKLRRSTFSFTLDKKNYSVKGNTFLIANTLSLFKLKPAAPLDLSDGQFEILITKNRTFAGFLFVVFFLFTNKRWLPSIFKKSGRSLTMVHNLETHKIVQIDGEIIKNIEKIEIEILPQKLAVVV